MINMLTVYYFLWLVFFPVSSHEPMISNQCIRMSLIKAFHLTEHVCFWIKRTKTYTSLCGSKLFYVYHFNIHKSTTSTYRNKFHQFLNQFTYGKIVFLYNSIETLKYFLTKKKFIQIFDFAFFFIF